jgi:hypothetical protein
MGMFGRLQLGGPVYLTGTHWSTHSVILNYRTELFAATSTSSFVMAVEDVSFLGLVEVEVWV